MKNTLSHWCLAIICLICSAFSALAAGTPLHVAFTETEGAFNLSKADIYIDRTDENLIGTVAGMFASDLEAVTGRRPAILKKTGKNRW